MFLVNSLGCIIKKINSATGNYMFLSKPFFALIVLSTAVGCVDPNVVKGARISCGIIDVLVKETDLGKFATAFSGDDQIGTKVCKAILDDGTAGGLSDPVEIPVGQRTLTLPNGDVVTVGILRPDQN
ncbi:MAG: hypothetical protein N4A53_03045 [Pelagimonas sp.]|jgi:hypothetical protein|nr:hypothetical protein [Pelagimonas sp.]